MWVDGTERTQDATSFTMPDNAGSTRFGGRVSNALDHVGQVDDAFIAERALADSEIATDLWNAGTGATVESLADHNNIIVYYDFETLDANTLLIRSGGVFSTTWASFAGATLPRCAAVCGIFAGSMFPSIVFSLLRVARIRAAELLAVAGPDIRLPAGHRLSNLR